MTAAGRGWGGVEIARRAYAELEEGQYVNLGIGMPTAVLDVAQADEKEVVFHSENGILGLRGGAGLETPDPDVIDAGKSHAALVDGGAFFHHAESFAMIRGGHIDVAVMGAYQVAANGDLANWSSTPSQELHPTDRRAVPAVGGAVDLAAGAGRVIVVMRSLLHGDRPRLVADCTLPVTGRACVDLVICDVGVFRPLDGVFLLEQVADGVDANTIRDLFSAHDVPLKIPAHATPAGGAPGGTHGP